MIGYIFGGDSWPLIQFKLMINVNDERKVIKLKLTKDSILMIYRINLLIVEINCCQGEQQLI